ncbi:MAG: glycoside hydrolase family 3 C-terminal domain-containing protein, partial [Oscillospiraceae bacterium]|nr:glycoside hydrolase family 3 C-terminal domain-containing protein [Oscillospiraceae bacterium]
MNDYEREHNAILRRLGAECAVLLRSNGAFPLSQPCEVALYGSGARRTIKGGTGSGEVNSRCFVTVEQGLEDAGFTISTKYWLEDYENLYASARRDFVRELKQKAKEHHTVAIVESMGAVMPEMEYNIPLTGAGDTALYVLSRISGEGSDRRAIPGDVLLTETEKRDILALNEKYKNFLLVLNVGGVVDLSAVAEVGNILLLSQLGVETGSILADLLLGKSVPSGKLTTTWSAWADYPTIGSFGEKDDTRYKEGIYVGYRYFDTVGQKALFPFGFGLGYTSFALSGTETALDGETVTVSAEVRNTGSLPGKEVAQLYVSAPQGRLDKPYQTLAAFTKTGEIAPGESENVTLSFCLRDLASYDEKRAAWILEKGDYVLRLGNSSTQTKPAAILRLDADAMTRQGKNCLG